MKKSIVELDNVWKVYKMGEVDVPAVRGISLKIKEGEFVAIIGASGSGKSTTMNMVGCLDYPTKGKVLLDGKNIQRMSEAQLAQTRGKKIGFIFQTFNLIPSLNALENVMLPMTFQNYSQNVKVKTAKDLLNKVNLTTRMHHKPSQLSGGERQRVAVARALANDPELILADEPTGNLDSKTGKQIMDMLDKLNEEGKTIVLVTHDLNIAEGAERVVRLKDGQIVQEVKNGKRVRLLKA
ncbi:ABC transporter ATP-binding protein [Candidatus Woesearchaeota archaeon]|nr:MAG: ABC transporter ATP-binding protein [Candidatus Woesearchaeota archaeon]